MQAALGIRARLYHVAELLVRYPDPEQRLAAADALDTPNELLAEAPRPGHRSRVAAIHRGGHIGGRAACTASGLLKRVGSYLIV
ncbi:hypothetical protein GCM10011378_39260 [Hymenobacter glacieicola]|uniref:Uncharacterized protein n=1 Tax=Hymenobacter glacieicola TaxID=1562124 RepID=A0ABQ1X4E2_9BACT|nr:hypothetical protein GCM10011378_39260 [Hymenobacter glacieicola]